MFLPITFCTVRKNSWTPVCQNWQQLSTVTQTADREETIYGRISSFYAFLVVSNIPEKWPKNKKKTLLWRNRKPLLTVTGETHEFKCARTTGTGTGTIAQFDGTDDTTIEGRVCQYCMYRCGDRWWSPCFNFLILLIDYRYSTCIIATNVKGARIN